MVEVWCAKSATHYWAFFFVEYVKFTLLCYRNTDICMITTQPTHFFNKTVQRLTQQTLHRLVCN